MRRQRASARLLFSSMPPAHERQSVAPRRPRHHPRQTSRPNALLIELELIGGVQAKTARKRPGLVSGRSGRGAGGSGARRFAGVEAPAIHCALALLSYVARGLQAPRFRAPSPEPEPRTFDL